MPQTMIAIAIGMAYLGFLSLAVVAIFKLVENFHPFDFGEW